MTEQPHAYPNGTNPKPAHAHIGPQMMSYRTRSPGNGSDEGRARAHVGPSADPNGSETVSHGLTGHVGNPAGAPVGPVLDGNTDTRGLVDDVEREHLAAGYGAVVRGLRKGAGLSQVQLGQLAGIGVTHISRLEQGRRRPSVDATKALARILSPVPDPTRLEQRLAELAGESLREGAARRKRRQENKHRKESAALITKHIKRIRRQIAVAESRGLPVSDTMHALAGFDLPERMSRIQNDPGIEGHEPVKTTRDHKEEIRELIRMSAKGRRR